ncbi:MAG: hypothetical protein QY326_00965 [Bdellovibrionota bacterium]|nr:MAG: hypothetical protein QY326_00965 [Bdellovibrionota bacterium]
MPQFLTIILLFLVTLLSMAGCAELGTPYSSGGTYGGGSYGGYQDPYYSGSRYDDYYYREKERTRDERRELERERERLEEERERLEEERRRAREAARRPPPPPPQPRCESGWRPSDHKCSSEERKRGCKDMRLPSGQLCVKR